MGVQNKDNFQCCLADGLNQSLVLSVAQANAHAGGGGGGGEAGHRVGI